MCTRANRICQSGSLQSTALELWDITAVPLSITRDRDDVRPMLLLIPERRALAGIDEPAPADQVQSSRADRRGDPPIRPSVVDEIRSRADLVREGQ